MTTQENELMSIEVKAARLATDFAYCIEGISQDMNPTLCSEAQFIYSRMEQITGMICDLRKAIWPDKNYQDGTVLWEWTANAN